MVQVRLSYEEQIINALSKLSFRRSENSLERDQKRFNKAIRDTLQPLYDRVKSLEDEQKVRVARDIAVAYAAHLEQKLDRFSAEDAELPHSDTSVKHLKWMCRQVMERAGYVPNEMSATKLHRWIGYLHKCLGSLCYPGDSSRENLFSIKALECL